MARVQNDLFIFIAKHELGSNMESRMSMKSAGDINDRKNDFRDNWKRFSGSLINKLKIPIKLKW